jgi:hypothetical protein
MMPATMLFQGRSIAVIDYQCTAGPVDKAFVEVLQSYSASYVRDGSFGCRARGSKTPRARALSGSGPSCLVDRKGGEMRLL